MCVSGGSENSPVVTSDDATSITESANGVYTLQLCTLPANISVQLNGVVTEVAFVGNNQVIQLDCGGGYIFSLLILLSILDMHIKLFKLIMNRSLEASRTFVMYNAIEYHVYE